MGTYQAHTNEMEPSGRRRREEIEALFVVAFQSERDRNRAAKGVRQLRDISGCEYISSWKSHIDFYEGHLQE